MLCDCRDSSIQAIYLLLKLARGEDCCIETQVKQLPSQMQDVALFMNAWQCSKLTPFFAFAAAVTLKPLYTQEYYTFLPLIVVDDGTSIPIRKTAREAYEQQHSSMQRHGFELPCSVPQKGNLGHMLRQ